MPIWRLLHELVPNAALIGLLINPNFPSAGSETREMQSAARAVGRNLIILNASTESEIDTAFATLLHQQVGALIVTGDPFFVSRRDRIVALSAQQARYPRFMFSPSLQWRAASSLTEPVLPTPTVKPASTLAGF